MLGLVARPSPGSCSAPEEHQPVVFSEVGKVPLVDGQPR
jgi:hypothetical protein